MTVLAMTARRLSPISRTALAIAALAMGVAPVAASAQQAADQQAQQDAMLNQTPAGGLDIPANVVLPQTANPNIRSATALINGQVITGTDVDQRLALILAANQQEVSDAEMARLRMQVLRNLIDETLQIQEARAQEMAVSPEEIEQTYARVATQNFGQDTAAMDAYLAQIGSSPASLKRQIEGEVSWQRLLRRNIQPFVNVSEEEVNELLQRLEASRGTVEYRLGEIFLSATPENKAAVFENAQRIVGQLRQGGSFAAYARQFSEASTAAVGGDLDWIRLPQLQSPELETVVREMQPGQLVGPVEIPGGFSILYLADQRQVLMADPRDAVLSLKQISINLDPGMSQDRANARVQQFTQAVAAMRGCGTADAAAAQIGADVVNNDQIRVRSLPGPLQEAMLQLQVGQSTPPFGSIEEGVRVLMLCGRDDPGQAEGPDFESIMARLEDDRVNKRAQRYLRDLRRDAIIEYN
jgi:peptidyl-prolyl cis-trans isomerase SurA